MQRDMIQRELTHVDLDVDTQDAFFDFIVEELLRLGYVKSTYLEALKVREGKFPTALPTQPEAIAIPHADVEHIVKPFIAAVRLKDPVPWHEMGNSEVLDQVRFVFLLGFLRTDGHVKLLQVLLNNCQDPDFMKSLADATSADEYYQIVHGMRGFKD